MTMVRCLRLSAVFVLGVASVTGACSGGAEGDSCPRWDSDCDNITTATELHAPNLRYHFDTAQYDPDPSFPNGSLANGSITNAINLAQEDGFYQYRPGSDPIWDHPDSNDWGTLKLLRVVQSTGRGWKDFDPASSDCYYYEQLHNSYAAAQFGVGDLSKFGGGYWQNSDYSERHAQHQNGLEVDIRFLRLDAQNLPFDLKADSAVVAGGGSSNYDLYGTIDLINCFLNTGWVDSIYLDSALVGFWGAHLSNHADHYNHFHVVALYP